MSHYIELYSGNQRGSGLSDIQVYRGPLHRQSGSGWGTFFNTAAQYLKPLLYSGVNALRDQGIQSAGSVLSQLGQKNLKTILNEESKKAVRNLSDKAIQKLQRNSGIINGSQKGSGIMPFGLSSLQLKRLSSSRKKSIKTPVKKKGGQSVRRRKIGSGTIRVKKQQIGAGKKRRGRKPTTKRKQTSKKRHLDIFN